MSNGLHSLIATPAALAALIVALISALVSLFSLLFTPISQRFIEAAKTGLQKDLEDYKSEIAKELSETNSRLSYEFEARKRLYSQVEPLLFQLFEASEQAYYRIVSLVRTFRAGNLHGTRSWLAHEGYYLRSTIYWLFLPLAIFRNLQRTATFFDLRLDENIRIRYFLLKWSYLGFTDDFDLAQRKPLLTYDPVVGEESPNRIAEDPARYSRQGTVLGFMDRLTEAMVVVDGGNRRIMSFGEFDGHMEDERFRRDFLPIINVFCQFDFENRPILARMLLAQALLHRLVLYSYTCDATIEGLHNALQAFIGSDEFGKEIRWWQGETESPMAAVLPYVHQRLGWISQDEYGIKLAP
jgi:hypothetical protein